MTWLNGDSAECTTEQLSTVTLLTGPLRPVSEMASVINFGWPFCPHKAETRLGYLESCYSSAFWKILVINEEGRGLLTYRSLTVLLFWNLNLDDTVRTKYQMNLFLQYHCRKLIFILNNIQYVTKLQSFRFVKLHSPSQWGIKNTVFFSNKFITADLLGLQRQTRSRVANLQC